MLSADGTRLLRPEEETFYEFYVALPSDAPSPAITARLFRLEPGGRLWVADHAKGQNTLSQVRPEDDTLLAATGTGEAPHNRMVWDLLRRGHRGRIASVCRRAGASTRPTGPRTSVSCNCIRAIATCRSRRARRAAGPHLQDLLRSGELEAAIGFRLDPSRGRVFLCGNPAMIGAPRIVEGRLVYPPALGMVEILARERGFGVDPHDPHINLHFERY